MEFVSEPRVPPFPDEWYDLARPDHFWLAGRLAFALAAARRAGIATHLPARVLEVGGGAAVLRDQLEQNTAWVVDVAEINADALSRARPGRGRLLCYDVLDRHADLVGAYDGLVLFDVLEHVDPTGPFVDALLQHLHAGGWLLVNVPALPRFHGTYDRAAGHHRRYSPASLAAEFAGTDLDVVEVSYWGLVLLPLLIARHLVQRRAPADGAVIRRGFSPPGRAANHLLRWLLRLECALFSRPPRGTSLLLCGRRR